MSRALIISVPFGPARRGGGWAASADGGAGDARCECEVKAARDETIPAAGVGAPHAAQNFPAPINGAPHFEQLAIRRYSHVVGRAHNACRSVPTPPPPPPGMLPASFANLRALRGVPLFAV